MIADSRSLPAGERITADVCIVGAGAAGITLAHEFAGLPFEVCLLESGGFEIEGGTQELYSGAIVGQDYHALDVSRLRYFGGTTNHWAGYCRPFDDIDFEPRPYIADSGWPFGSSTLEPYYRRAQAICRLGRYDYDVAGWRELPYQPFDLDPMRMLSEFFQVHATRFGPAYREMIDAAPNIKALLHANVTDIRVEGTEVSDLAVACLDGKAFTVEARFYILATGAVENARLLLSSNKVRHAGIGNTYDNVGRYFMDHPIIWQSGQLVTAGRRDETQFYCVEQPVDGMRIVGFFRPPSAVQKAEQLYNCAMMLDPVNLSARSEAVTSAKHILSAVQDGRMPDDLALHVGRMFDELNDIVELAEGAHRRLFKPVPSQFTTRFACECPPDRDSRVTLGGDTDALGLRRVNLEWRLPADFRRHYERMHELLALELGRKGIGRLQIGKDGSVDEALASIEGSFHQMGTTRMHESPRKGVVDADCRVHDVANLFVAGSSVFPTYGHANPTFMIVTLAARLADHIKQQFRQFRVRSQPRLRHPVAAVP